MMKMYIAHMARGGVVDGALQSGFRGHPTYPENDCRTGKLYLMILGSYIGGKQICKSWLENRYAQPKVRTTQLGVCNPPAVSVLTFQPYPCSSGSRRPSFFLMPFPRHLMLATVLFTWIQTFLQSTAECTCTWKAV